MAENLYPVLSLCATVHSRLSDLSITDGQLIFVQDKQMIALDYNGKRKFYTQIEELATEAERTALLAPVTGRFYFVVETGILWTYTAFWKQLTAPPEDILFIGVDLPSLGQNGTLYVNKGIKNISVWDDEQQDYIVVADKTNTISVSDIEKLFE